MSGVDTLDFDSVRTFLDYDVVILDLPKIRESLRSEHAGFRIAEKRKEEIREVLALGRTVVAFVCDFQLDSILPTQSLLTKESVGSRMDIKGPDHLGSFCSATNGLLEYLAFFDNIEGCPFLYVADTNKAVATWIKSERGHILLLPWLIEANTHSNSYRLACSRFVDALKVLVRQLAPPNAVMHLPAWTSGYTWDREKSLRDELVLLRAQSEALVKSVSELSKKLATEEELKVLLSAKGGVLVSKILELLRELGLEAEGGKPGRDDIIIKFGKKYAVVEVKGKKKSAAEEDAAQLEKWVSGFKAEHSVHPKGILFVNAFSETPLAQRHEAAFPHQMLKYCVNREHCLITTTQFLGLLLEARSHPGKRVKLVESLFSTVGIYEGFSDWRKFVTSSGTESEESK